MEGGGQGRDGSGMSGDLHLLYSNYASISFMWLYHVVVAQSKYSIVFFDSSEVKKCNDPHGSYRVSA